MLKQFLYSGGIFFVVVPAQGIVQDVFVNPLVVFVVPQDVFVIIPLPDGSSGGVAQGVDAAGDGGLVASDEGAERSWPRAVRMFFL